MKYLIAILLLWFSFFSLAYSQYTPKLVPQNNHNAPVNQVEYSYNGEWVASASDDKTIKIWHTQSGRLYKTFNNRECVAKAIKFHPKKNQLLSTCGKNILIWDIHRGKIVDVLKGHKKNVFALDFTKDGKYLASGGAGETVIVWKYKKRRKIRRLKERLLYNNTIYSVKFSNTGEYLFSAGEDIKIKMWNWRKRKIVKNFRLHKFRINTLAINKYDNILASASNDYTIKVWNIVTGKEIATLKAYDSPVQSIAFHPNGNGLFATYYKNFKDSTKSFVRKRIEGHVALWNLNKLDIVWDHSQDGGIMSMDISKDQQHLVISDSNKKIKLLNVNSGKVQREIGISTRINDMVYAPQRNHLLVAGDYGNIKVIDLNKGEIEKTLETDYQQKITALAYDTARNILVAGVNNVIECWNYESYYNRYKKLSTFSIGEGKITAIEFMNNSQNIIVSRTKHMNIYAQGIENLDAYKEGIIPEELIDYTDSVYVEVWNMQNGEFVHNLKKIEAENFAYTLHPQKNDMVFADENQNILLCNLESGAKPVSFLVDNHTNVSSLNTWENMATTNLYNSKKVERKFNESLKINFAPELKNVLSFAYSSDSRFLGYGGYRKQLEIWDAQDKKLRQIGFFSQPVKDICFSPDNKYVATASGKNAQIWRADTSILIHSFESKQQIDFIEFSADGKRLISGGKNDAIKIWDIENKDLIVSFIPVGKKDYIIINKDFYYDASPDGEKGVAISYWDRPYPIEQFKLKYYRPDIIKEQLQISDDREISQLRIAYQKQLKQIGMNEASLSKANHIPRISIIDKDEIPVKTNYKSYLLNVRATDIEHNIDRINIFVNNVPVYGVDGFNVRKFETDIFQRSFKVPLQPGMNTIAFSCMNEKGAVSYKDSVRIYSKADWDKPDLYMVGIASDEYQNQGRNRKYSVKDMYALFDTFTTDSNNYNKIHRIEITNRDVNKQNINELAQVLNEINFHDKLIFFVGGSSLLSESQTAYLATWNTNFSSPDSKAVPFSQIQKLVSNCPAQHKLFIFENRPVGEALGNFQLLNKQLFSNHYVNFGVETVRSPYAVTELSEKEKSSNGVVTHFILKGLENLNADFNRNKKVESQELIHYVNREIENMHPENTSKNNLPNNKINFTVWQ